MLAIPSSQLDRGVFIDENALQPGQVRDNRISVSNGLLDFLGEHLLELE